MNNLLNIHSSMKIVLTANMYISDSHTLLLTEHSINLEVKRKLSVCTWLCPMAGAAAKITRASRSWETGTRSSGCGPVRNLLSASHLTTEFECLDLADVAYPTKFSLEGELRPVTTLCPARDASTMKISRKIHPQWHYTKTNLLEWTPIDTYVSHIHAHDSYGDFQFLLLQFHVEIHMTEKKWIPVSKNTWWLNRGRPWRTQN